MTTTKYKMSYIKKIIFYKKKLLIFLIIILASVPAFRYLGINISATIFSYLLGIERSDLHSPSTPRLELAERVRCGLADPQISMPSYDFWLSKKDFSNLDIPAKTNEKGEFLQRDLVRASVRLREPGDQLGKFGAVRVRKRGFQQSAPNKPFPLKVEMLNNDPSPFRLSHLLYFGMVGAKDTRWWPFHMWVARRLGLITPENRLVRVAVDGKKWGVFWQFEHWGGRTLKTNGIFGGEIYAESDETLPVVSPYLWENIDNWKKYDMHNVPGEGREDYFELDILNNGKVE